MPLELDARQRAMLQEMGVRVWLPGTDFATEGAASPQSAPTTVATPVQNAPVRSAPSQTVSAALLPQPVEVQSMADTPWADLDWAQLISKAQACEACGLCAGRTHTTLAAYTTATQSQTQVDWLVVGDPPDEEEDQAGLAFAGQAGVLMDNMLKAMGASRTGSGAQGAYLSNVTKCRPPHGRNPQLAELQQCAGFLQREIALVRPKVILALGRFATQLLLANRPDVVGLPLGKQRGVVYRYLGIPVIVSYHPKVLLRASADKGKAWADLCLAMDVRDGLV
jgi:DNA polymerase